MRIDIINSVLIILYRKFFIGRRRNIMSLHKGFCKGLTAFQLCSLFRWTDDIKVVQRGIIDQKISNSFYQGFFGSDKQEIDLLIDATFFYRIEIIHAKIQIRSMLRSAGIAGSNK